MSNGTKDRIIETSLDLFSKQGYYGTSMSDIAKALGLTKAALYKHFESKEEIWDAVHSTMIGYYDANFGSVDNIPHIPETTSELYEMTMRMVNFTVHDENVIRMRKILLTEQFHDERAKRLATTYFLYDTEAIFTRVFTEMMESGSIRRTDPRNLAFSYTAPITSLIHLCDREPEKETEAMEKLKCFISHFIEEYGITLNNEKTYN